eukprot:Anaeramoba_flamelloidesa810364_57.p1 GENE.a810364_57~~a810364_57.p1  ORF type:complete len:443 (-),score=117.14 a810364_57:60-1388(-)
MSFVVLLSGTSGCGKSTLASLVASRLGIQNVLSTDSIRHTLRNFTSQENCPILFASTYNAGECVDENEITTSNEEKLEETFLHKKKTIMGYQKQCSLIYDKLETILSSYQVSNRSLIVEGVHLYNKTLLKLMRKYPNVIPFVLYIKNAKKQKERFAVRSKYMTLDTTKNKYVKYFENIRLIQGSQVKLANLHLIPTIENSNTDKSVSVVHHTVFKCLRKLANGEKFYDPKAKKAKTIYEVYARKIKNTLNTESAQKLLSQKNIQNTIFNTTDKDKIINKDFNFVQNQNKFFSNDNLNKAELSSSSSFGNGLFFDIREKEILKIQEGIFPNSLVKNDNENTNSNKNKDNNPQYFNKNNTIIKKDQQQEEEDEEEGNEEGEDEEEEDEDDSDDSKEEDIQKMKKKKKKKQQQFGVIVALNKIIEKLQLSFIVRNVKKTNVRNVI